MLFISIDAGTTLNDLYRLFDTKKSISIVRVMPNMNASIKESASAICGNKFTAEEQIQLVIQLFNFIGKTWRLDENYFSVFTAIAGSSPAYALLFIDSVAKAAVKNGFPKDMALEMVTQSVLGSAMLLSHEKEKPWNLIDRISSPGGTTITEIVELENNNFVSSVIKGIEETIKKDKELSK